MKKTQIMCLNCPDDRRVSIDGRELEEVGEFCYLGSLLTPYGGSVKDVANRLKVLEESGAQGRLVGKQNWFSTVVL